jgi:hypothetical protein
MSEILINKSKWFWAWADDKEEAWLRANANQGLHLVQARPFGLYVFRQGIPRDVVYRLDYISSPKKDDLYFQLFRDAGWEYVGEMMGWQYWRKKAIDDNSDEIFTDSESKTKKYRRLLGFMVIFLPVLIFNVTNFGSIPSDGHTFFFTGVQLFSFALLLFYSYAMLRIVLRINQLKRL